MTKQTQRQLALAARRALSPEQRAAYSAAICARLASLEALRGAKTILSYRALPDEADPAALETALPGARFAYPRCLPDRALEAYIPAGQALRGPFGIPEPDPTCSLRLAPEAIDVVLTPCVGFDDGLRRLGHGAGYYDRYLPRCRRALLICLAFEAQRLPRVDVEAHDHPVALVVTERKIYTL